MSNWNPDNQNYNHTAARRTARGVYVCRCGLRTNDGSGVCASCLVESRSIPVITAAGHSAADIIATMHLRRAS